MLVLAGDAPPALPPPLRMMLSWQKCPVSDPSTTGRARGGCGAAAAPATRPDVQMLPMGSALVSSKLAVLPPPPSHPPTLPVLLLPPEKISVPEPERWWPGGCSGLLPSSSPEWFPRLPPLPTAAATALPGAGNLADPVDEDEDDGVAAAGHRRSGETGEPRSTKTSAFRSGLSPTPSLSWSASATARRRIRSALAITGARSQRTTRAAALPSATKCRQA
jgi:hypothetical protein